MYNRNLEIFRINHEKAIFLLERYKKLLHSKWLIDQVKLKTPNDFTFSGVNIKIGSIIVDEDCSGSLYKGIQEYIENELKKLRIEISSIGINLEKLENE